MRKGWIEALRRSRQGACGSHVAAVEVTATDTEPSAAEPTHVAVAFERLEVIRRAFWLEYVTVAWMVIETVVAIWSGVQAASVCLVAFGIDSLIELASAGVLIWRLRVEVRRGQAFAESAASRAQYRRSRRSVAGSPIRSPASVPSTSADDARRA